MSENDITLARELLRKAAGENEEWARSLAEMGAYDAAAQERVNKRRIEIARQLAILEAVERGLAPADLETGEDG